MTTHLHPGPHAAADCAACRALAASPKLRARWGVTEAQLAAWLAENPWARPRPRPPRMSIAEIARRRQDCAKLKRLGLPCPHEQPATVMAARAQGELACGVAIGSYKFPGCVDLNIRAIRQTCGPVPILISDDCSPGFPDADRYARLQAVCAAHADVTLAPNAARIGHTGGDVATFHKAVTWAAARGLRVVAKISQRWIAVADGWLQHGAAELLASGLPLASQRCSGVETFDLRTEACLLDVPAWNAAAVLTRIRPRRYWTDSPRGLTAETVIYRVLQDLLGGVFWPWSLLGEERHEARPGFLWHTVDRLAAYQRLAEQLGGNLDDDFHVGGWQRDPTYLYG